MNIVEKIVSAGGRAIFELDEFLSRPLYAHLAHNSDQGPRESPVWFHWDGQAIWVIGGKSFPANLKRDPRCAWHREPAVKAIQTFQVLMQDRVVKIALDPDRPFRLPWIARMMLKIPILRDLPANLIAFGIRRGRIDE